ncbi:hypothetical protein [Undibacterium sp. TS12]|uniref:hypothetical protein n=1 Tax=Undibacterium sp. TS12 TaxID=2908202 RepID=UPI001F4C9617|nr:hypothetical protein [Undibacterium sp. TS12]MCH8622852.1 hypothetical protein [Undibacterium sp. TS12]
MLLQELENLKTKNLTTETQREAKESMVPFLVIALVWPDPSHLPPSVDWAKALSALAKHFYMSFPPRGVGQKNLAQPTKFLKPKSQHKDIEKNREQSQTFPIPMSRQFVFLLFRLFTFLLPYFVSARPYVERSCLLKIQVKKKPPGFRAVFLEFWFSSFSSCAYRLPTAFGLE